MSYPPQGAAGVADFLGLTDTPAVYAGEGLKGARVNVGETALEFGPMYEGPIHAGYPNNIIFGPAAGPGAWTDLDIGEGPGMAIIKIESGVNVSHDFRRKGDTLNISVSALCRGTTIAAHPLSYVCVITDAAGFVQWKNGTSLATLTLIAFWPDIPMPNTVFSGATGPGAYSDIDLGVANAMCYLKVETTDVGGFVARFRCKGETLSAQGGISCGFPTSTVQDYVMVPTDSNGVCQWIGNATKPYTITLLGYILGATFPKLVLYDGIPPDGNIYEDLDSPLGRGWAYIRAYTADAPGISARFRENGEASSYGTSNGICFMGPTAGNIVYALMPADVYGTCEWCYHLGVAAGQEYQLRAEAMME